jgi:alkylation response protein AidB-like acyl-CoA dehydrogenase
VRVTVELVEHWLATGRIDLPLPASGHTAQRWDRLALLAEEDIVAGRIAEAHADAVAILHELGGKPTEAGQLWAVWAAESGDTVVEATPPAGGYVALSGVKPWCSGAGFCTHALVTARLPTGQRGLFAVAVTEPAVTPMVSTWCNPGMAGSDTRSVRFRNAPAVLVGDPGAYLSRPGFWHGAIGVAACWLGGTRAVARPLYQRVAGGSADPHTLAHLGAVDAAIAAAEATLATVAVAVDADPFDSSGEAHALALRVRAVVEHVALDVINRSGRALGPGPLCHDRRYAQDVADLTVYLRQSHAERDLAELGRLVGQRQ